MLAEYDIAFDGFRMNPSKGFQKSGTAYYDASKPKKGK
jgi:hypothetical protein